MDSWLEVAIVAALFAIGNIMLGHLEAGTPKWRRVLKVILVLTTTRLISTQLGSSMVFSVHWQLGRICADCSSVVAATARYQRMDRGNRKRDITSFVGGLLHREGRQSWLS